MQEPSPPITNAIKFILDYLPCEKARIIESSSTSKTLYTMGGNPLVKISVKIK
jgi:hypothetical protein